MSRAFVHKLNAVAPAGVRVLAMGLKYTGANLTKIPLHNYNKSITAIANKM